MNIFVTGASGYIGQALCRELVLRNYIVHGVGRSKLGMEAVFNYTQCELESDDVASLIQGHDCVVHLAGRAHVLGGDDHDSIAAFRHANKDVALHVAKLSINAGVKRFIFISSIGVNGAFTTDKPFSEQSKPEPLAAYALSKYEAEISLQELVSNSDMELVIIRPPLVYSDSAPGNFRRLLKLVSLGVPLPFGSIANSRSMVALANFIDFIQTCMIHPAAANEVFLISDGLNISTAEIVNYLAQGMQKKILMLPVPDFFMRKVSSAIGKKSLYVQLCGSLVIDSSKAQRLLGWDAPCNAIKCLNDAGRMFRDNV